MEIFTLKSYWSLIKPKIVLAMLSLYFAPLLANLDLAFSSLNLFYYFLGFVGVFTSVGGANALNCYLDRDIDLLMFRTRKRPLPLGKIKPNHALFFSLTLLGFAFTLSVIACLTLSPIPMVLLFVGVLCYILLYTVVAKRRSRLNVFLVSPANACPVWLGWFLAFKSINLHGFILGVLAALWGPLHLWIIAYIYSQDYRRAGIPMLPVLVERKKSVLTIFGVTMLLVLASYIPYFLGFNRFVYLATITVLNLLMVYFAVKFLLDPKGRNGWKLFKLTAPYIILILFMSTIDFRFTVFSA